MSWNAQTYLTYGDERTRPAGELLGRVPLLEARRIYDLGCGPGNSTKLLRDRYPEASITGVDNAQDMLHAAQASGVRAEWAFVDLVDFAPVDRPDLLYANATFQWLDDHPRLFGRLLESLAPGGVLAVQMPRNFDAPSHRVLREVASSGPWAERLRPLLRVDPVADSATYYRWLKPKVAQLDVWETEYLQVLRGPDPVLAWVKGTALVPLLAALPEAEGKELLERYRQRLLSIYPAEAGGETLFPFKRIFFVATVR